MKHSTVVLVNNEPPVETEMAASSERTGRPWVTAHTKAEALQTLDELNGNIGLVVENLTPRVTGLALLKEMKSQHHEIPVVVLTSPGEGNIVKLALVFGADSSMDKPHRRIQLRRMVRHYCDGAN